ncbi:transporter substrate-binding domain-containing protein [Endozoicomonas sp. SM1973]|uniref:Transporter substrate-binding domain-containing protein n=1 Tax=Spartinivicinus marinus TaxID=2994442 RepID=A0A853HVI6_9GAMM|nr:transporter substrate-binding domain-containing protein [Spartinivicinus marinus]MCX4025777.1 transporter substrate-binding domain-containing protein [Spartinivicinus marinus]NYZ65770.1 transporter substrate-binding domain-containing protein [Spartinivicinus marinus]
MYITNSAPYILYFAVTGSIAGECTTIKMAGDMEYPPVTWQYQQDKAKIYGLAVELAEKAFAEINVKVNPLHVGDWAKAQLATKQGKTDLLAGAYFNEERKTYLDYVHPPFLTDPVVIFIPSKKAYNFKFTQWQDLVKLQGVTTVGSSFGQEFDEFTKKHLKIEYKTQMSDTFKQLISGRADYLVHGLYPGLASLAKAKLSIQITPHPKYVTEEGLYFGFSKKSPCKKHLAFFSKKIKEYVQQKIPHSLTKKYFDLWKKDFGLKEF